MSLVYEVIFISKVYEHINLKTQKRDSHVSLSTTKCHGDGVIISRPFLEEIPQS